MDRDLECLVDRLNELEGENRKWRRATLVILIGLAALLVMGQARTPRVVKADELVAHKLILLDDRGRPIAVLDVDKDGAALALGSATGKARVGLSVTKRGPVLVLWDAAGKASAALLVDQDGPSLVLGHAVGKSRAMLGFSENQPYLEIEDDEGFKTVVGTTDLVTPRTGEQHKRSAASAVMCDKEGKLVWSAP